MDQSCLLQEVSSFLAYTFIEAARAGEARKGFASVANGIQELAQQTALATSQIKSAISCIQSQTEVTIVDIEGTLEVISEVNDIVGSIATAVEEQAVTTNEIATNVTQASIGIIKIHQNIVISSQLTNSMSQGVGRLS